MIFFLMIQVINNESNELKFQHIYNVCQIKLPKDRTKKLETGFTCKTEALQESFSDPFFQDKKIRNSST